MRDEPWVWPEVGNVGTSGAGAVPLRSAQMMGQQQQKKKKVSGRSMTDHCNNRSYNFSIMQNTSYVVTNSKVQSSVPFLWYF